MLEYDQLRYIFLGARDEYRREIRLAEEIAQVRADRDQFVAELQRSIDAVRQRVAEINQRHTQTAERISEGEEDEDGEEARFLAEID